MQVLGGLKIGTKQLFVYVPGSGQMKCQPVCVLDFYVHRDYQRLDIGKALFEVRSEGLSQAPELDGSM